MREPYDRSTTNKQMGKSDGFVISLQEGARMMLALDATKQALALIPMDRTVPSGCWNCELTDKCKDGEVVEDGGQDMDRWLSELWQVVAWHYDGGV